MPSLAVVIAYEAMAKASARHPVAHRKGNMLRNRVTQFWGKIRSTRASAPAGLRVARPANVPVPVPRLRPAH